jgi:hypothetical protein
VEAPDADPRLRRRTVLRLAAAVPALAVTGGCGAVLPGERRTPRALTPAELVVERTAGEALRLRDAALALAKTKGQPGELLRTVAADHDEHLAALGAVPVAGEVTSPPASTAPPREEGWAQRDAEWRAAREALRDALAAEPGLATLLVRVAASRALHADALAAGRAAAAPDRLDPADPPKGATPSPARSGASSGASAAAAGDRDAALGRLLSGEYAAVFAYPAIVARCAPARRGLAEELWQAHVAERDELERLLTEDDGEPPAAKPAYDIGTPPADPAAAAKLAATVESRLATVAVAAVASTRTAERLLVARRAVTAARRAARWGGAAPALPG